MIFTIVVLVVVAILFLIAIDYLPVGDPKLKSVLKFLVVILVALYVLSLVVKFP